MRAIQIFTPGGPEVLTEVEIPTPRPNPGEIRVKAETIGIGRADVLVRKGIYKWMPPLPTIPGSEMVGLVDEVGSGASTGLKGKRVWSAPGSLSYVGVVVRNTFAFLRWRSMFCPTT